MLKTIQKTHVSFGEACYSMGARTHEMCGARRKPERIWKTAAARKASDGVRASGDPCYLTLYLVRIPTAWGPVRFISGLAKLKAPTEVGVKPVEFRGLQ